MDHLVLHTTNCSFFLKLVSPSLLSLGRLLKLMREMFGPQNANWWKEDQEKIAVQADQHTAILDPR